MLKRIRGPDVFVFVLLAEIKVQIGKGGWLKANHKQFGFYRVNYPVENWENLAKLLQNDHTVLIDFDHYMYTLAYSHLLYFTLLCSGLLYVSVLHFALRT